MEGYGIDASKIKIFEIENEPEMQAIQNHMGKITGGSTVPRIFIGGKFVGGCDEVFFFAKSPSSCKDCLEKDRNVIAAALIF